MPQTITLSPEEAKQITPFYHWADGYVAGMVAAMDAAKRRLVNDLIAARVPETPKQEVPDGYTIQPTVAAS